MAQPDRPNFSILQRIVFGAMPWGTICLLLLFLGYVPGK
jgi:hypothetical protein